ncbi:MAG: hypothetical protein ABSG65_29510 [Bryobacteraceae bacterium]|jgi:hypothetical protein
MMSKLVEQAIKGIQDEWPKALLGLTVPAAQYLWRLLHDRQLESRKQTLRARIVSLAEFRRGLVADRPEAATLAEEADREYSLAVEKLAAISAPIKAHTAASGAADSAFRRWFLFYTPRGLAWIPHTLYFVFLSIDVVGLIGVLSEVGSPDFSDGLIGIAVFILFTLLLRFWAARASSRSRQPDGPGDKSHGRIGVIVIIAAALLDLFFLLGISLDDKDDVSLTTLKDNEVSATVAIAFLLALAFGTWYRRRAIRRRRIAGSLAQSR